MGKKSRKLALVEAVALTLAAIATPFAADQPPQADGGVLFLRERLHRGSRLLNEARLSIARKP